MRIHTTVDVLDNLVMGSTSIGGPHTQRNLGEQADRFDCPTRLSLYLKTLNAHQNREPRAIEMVCESSMRGVNGRRRLAFLPLGECPITGVWDYWRMRDNVWTVTSEIALIA